MGITKSMPLWLPEAQSSLNYVCFPLWPVNLAGWRASKELRFGNYVA
jgi:hypothetical protein